MKVKLLLSFLKTIILISIFVSCTTHHAVVNNNWIQKRKYKKGYYFRGSIEKQLTKKKSILATKTTNKLTDNFYYSTQSHQFMASCSLTSDDMMVSSNLMSQTTEQIPEQQMLKSMVNQKHEKLSVLRLDKNLSYNVLDTIVSPENSINKPNQKIHVKDFSIPAFLSFLFSLWIFFIEFANYPPNFYYYLSLSLPGLILGIIGLINIKRKNKRGKGFAWFGLIISFLTITLLTIVILHYYYLCLDC